MARTWHFELGLEAVADDGGAHFILDLYLMGVLHPLPQFLIRTTASRLPKDLLNAGEHLRRQRRTFTRRNVEVE